mmetsp:Transcript_24732/g.65321  ORF Transcript_24732/g.65321 Transcript_24732/m.65321 type:complete len:203 (+) Transcript_24732:564-1172(+)
MRLRALRMSTSTPRASVATKKPIVPSPSNGSATTPTISSLRLKIPGQTSPNSISTETWLPRQTFEEPPEPMDDEEPLPSLGGELRSSEALAAGAAVRRMRRGKCSPVSRASPLSSRCNSMPSASVTKMMPWSRLAVRIWCTADSKSSCQSLPKRTSLEVAPSVSHVEPESPREIFGNSSPAATLSLLPPDIHRVIPIRWISD